MKLRLLFLSLLINLIGIQNYAQAPIWSENFNSGGSTFTLNTTDVINGTACVSGSVFNSWVVNNSYTGGTGYVTIPNPSTVCALLGGQLHTTVVATPDEPAGVTGNPHSNYLHIYCPLNQTQLGFANANWSYSDAYCVPAENYFCKMNVGVSTVGQPNVTLKFYWACGGVSTYGQLWYSINGGTSWTQVGSNYINQTTWTQQSISLPAFGNVADLRFGFLWVSPTVSLPQGADPAFAIDDISIEVPIAGNTITTGTITGSPFCAGSSISVPFIVSGNFTGGNVFTAQLSDASGSFALPVTLGTLTGTSSGTISGNIPSNITTGSSYLIRVIGSAPATTGSSSAAITVNALPAPVISTSDTLICSSDSTRINCSGSFFSYQWSNGDNRSFTYAKAAGGIWVTVTDVNSCSAISNHLNISVHPVPSVSIVVQGDTLSSYGAQSYQWFLGGQPISNATSSYYIAKVTGDYAVQITDNFGCKALSASTHVNVTGIEDLSGSANVKIFPNPASASFNITYAGTGAENFRLNMFNVIGEKVLQEVMSFTSGKTMPVNISHLLPGVYLLQLQSGRYTLTRKIVVQ